MSYKVVIISKDQSHHIINMRNKIKTQYMFVLDRCIDNSKQICIDNNINYITNELGIGFMAGHARQLGIDYFGVDEYILFLDGDKIPHGNLSIIEDYIEMGVDCVLFGVSDDPRGYPKNEILKMDKNNPHNGVYSCGILLSPRAMRICQSTSNLGRVWHEDFDGRWGDEDRWIGDILIYNDMSIMYSDKIILDGSIGGMSLHIEDFMVNTMKRMNLRKKIGYLF